MRDLDTILELHDVEYNRQLIADFFPAAFNALGKSGFVITWCDQMLWQYMHDCAVRAGFAVQKWPITWVKNNAMNQCVAYNTTKDTEIAIVCRKKSSVLTWQPNTSVIHAGKDDLCNRIDHPFAKPFLCWEFLIKMVSLEGQTILEPFAGRGSGVLSILDLKRKAIGIELDATHYSYLLENVKQFYLRLNPSFIFK
jgi:site-specific DNA-methyltransferase (adenine-specific)